MQRSIEEERKALQESRKQNEEWEAAQRKILQEAEIALAKNKQALVRLDEVEKNRKSNTELVLKEIQARIDDMSTTQRLVSRRASYYRCLRSDINDSGVADFNKCMRLHSIKTDSQEETQIKNWSELVGRSSSQVKLDRTKLVYDIQTKQNSVDFSNSALKNLPMMKKHQEEKEQALVKREKDEVIVKNNQHFINCDANTPDISLEASVPYPGAKFKGPFVGVPRDNQDGLGTCYANVAKNLLVGTSQGEDVASFLDVALAYKGAGGVVTSALNGGDSCSALKSIEEKGFCPQKNAPMEQGEENPYTKASLLDGGGSIYDQAILVKLLQKFLVGQKVLEQGNKEFSEQLLKQSKAIVHNIKLRPNVKIPMPIVRNPIPSGWKMIELHASVSKKNPGLSFDDFNNEYQKEYRKFYPSYVRGVVEGQSRDAIFEAFKTKMDGWISKYGLQNELKYWKNIFIEDTDHDFKSPTLKKDIAESVDFMKVMSGHHGKSDQDFLKFCDETMGDSFQFLSALQPLIKHMSQSKMSTDDLYDKDGKFRNPEELMQMVIAPSCVHADNRKKIAPVSCENGYMTVKNIKDSPAPYGEKLKQLRTRVVSSLVQGYPLGNTFDRHINTIVGIRFNRTSNRCEYQIRESQDATTSWQSETKIFDVMDALAEVRRK